MTPRRHEMSPSQKRTADLAICYHAYLTAEDHLDLRVWGQMLIEAQVAVGIEMLSPEVIRRRIVAEQVAPSQTVAA